MTLFLVELLIVLIGLYVTFIIFKRIPFLPNCSHIPSDLPSISIIIPARNEENNLALLLRDLSMQTLLADEIICVDDDSTDGTSKIALTFGASLISLQEKPEGWTGKTWACHNGANASIGEVLIFLDADVRLGKDGIGMLMQTYLKNGCTISVQPYHKTILFYEQFSFILNLIQIAANGTALAKPINIGLYGPIILISRADYLKAGGHERVRKSIVEDMALGAQLRKTGLSFRLYVGNETVSFRMYANGFKSLLQGWIKNIASGAARTPPLLFIMSFIWISSLTSVPIQVIKFVQLQNWPWFVIYTVLYFVWVTVLTKLARRIGNFQLRAIFFYPVLMAVTLVVFFISAFKRIFGFKVKWKGRALETGENS